MRSSKRQQYILEAIHRFQRDYRYPPTVRDIARIANISSTSVVHYHLKALEKLGHIRRRREVSRGIALQGDSSGRLSLVSVPIEGRIAAGEPLEAIPRPAETLELPPEIAPEGVYALRVKGRSMIGDLIDDGDLVLVRRQETAESGDIVVALLMDTPTGEWQATLKRFYHEKELIRLQPANSELAPLIIRPRDLRIQGKVVAVIRQFQ